MLCCEKTELKSNIKELVAVSSDQSSQSKFFLNTFKFDMDTKI